MDGFSKLLFNDEIPFKVWDYVNCGFQIVNKNHRHFFEAMKTYYNENSQKIIDTVDKLKCGTDQTIVNYMLHKEKIDVRILPSCYNLQDLFRKNLLVVHDQVWWEDSLSNMYQAGWVYHYNSIPSNPMKRQVDYWMERTYKELYGKLS